MLIQIILFLLLGILFGVFTGLTPGIHINLVSAILVSLSASYLTQISAIYLVVFISSMAIAHTFLDFIPSIFLGCPDTDTELSILPGHELLKEGRGYEAIMLTNYGSIAAVFMLLAISFPSVLLISKFYKIIEHFIPVILVFTSLILIMSEKNKFPAFLVFALSGFLGLIVLNLSDSSDKFLLPLLTGLFGSSMLLISIKNKTQIPIQKITKSKIKILKPLIGSFIASPICSFLPGLGSGQAAVIGNLISKTDKRGFLVLLGATNTLVMGFSFISLYTISKTRTGAAAAIQDLTGSLSPELLILILFSVLFSGLIAFFLTAVLAKFFSQKMEKINYQKISIATITVLGVIVFLVSGFLGIVILIISTLTGIYCMSFNVRKTNMMGCLLLPTILFYLLK
ncbi:MAG TPA: tripartite tricarboxylate transporter permease [Candidatus Nanoarchaeia archaeon]|nr:tripartite tricarboxylate transporter permease [Candidatus Nanoarchaeia archaeon]